MKLLFSVFFALLVLVSNGSSPLCGEPPAADAGKSHAEIARAGESSLELTISLPQIVPGEPKQIFCSGESPFFTVVLRNVSKEPVKVFRTGNSWGDWILRIEITDEQGVTRTERPLLRMGYWANGADCRSLAPGETVDYKVTFYDKPAMPGFGGDGRGIAKPVRDFETVTLKAIFEIIPDAITKEKSVWTGRVESRADKYVLRK